MKLAGGGICLSACALKVMFWMAFRVWQLGFFLRRASFETVGLGLASGYFGIGLGWRLDSGLALCCFWLAFGFGRPSGFD